MTKNIKPQDVNKWLTKRQGSAEIVTQRDHTPHLKSIKSELVLNFTTYKKGLLSFRGKGHRYVSYKPIDFIIVQLIKKLFWVNRYSTHCKNIQIIKTNLIILHAKYQ